ncbi:MAG: hypothetical protein IJL59_08615 [Clostridia bacterium]|jgi:cell division protein FtsL|nr:hypothetical protein [Clostridia bacterium]MBQ9188157.1 hypothetical protein [Clostridia bacterium]
MERPYGSEKTKMTASGMRLYRPTQPTSSKEVKRNRRRAAREARMQSELRFSTLSKVMILVSVFLVALTALLSLFGAAEYAQISTDIATIDADIESYQQMISQVKKTQSSMNDYASITDACLDRGMQMIWEPGNTQ